MGIVVPVALAYEDRVDDLLVGMLVEGPRERPEVAGKHDVVVVEVRHDVAGGGLEGTVERRTPVQAGAIDPHQPGIAEPVQHRGRVRIPRVRGHDQLPGLVALGLDRRERALQQRRAVPRGDDDRDRRGARLELGHEGLHGERPPRDAVLGAGQLELGHAARDVVVLEPSQARLRRLQPVGQRRLRDPGLVRRAAEVLDPARVDAAELELAADPGGHGPPGAHLRTQRAQRAQLVEAGAHDPLGFPDRSGAHLRCISRLSEVMPEPIRVGTSTATGAAGSRRSPARCR